MEKRTLGKTGMDVTYSASEEPRSVIKVFPSQRPAVCSTARWMPA
jgi:hypothetical protein